MCGGFNAAALAGPKLRNRSFHALMTGDSDRPQALAGKATDMTLSLATAGDLFANQFGTKSIIVQLDAPVLADTFISITSSDPGIAPIPGGGITILAGSTSAILSLSSLNLGGLSTLSFSLGAEFIQTTLTVFPQLAGGPTDISMSANSANESIIAGATVATLGAVDPTVGDTITFSLPGDGPFEISGNDIRLKANALLDYEQVNVYHLQIIATDVAGASYVEDFEFTVNNVDPERVTGTSGNDRILGGALGDTLSGASGSDTLEGGGGNDVLIGGKGADHLDGGANSDTLSYGGSTAVTINLATASASGGHATGDVFNNFENVTGSAGNDHITGDGDGNILKGASGTDDIDGGGGADNLQGGNGADHLTGGSGKDILTGGAQSDVFVFVSAAESPRGAGRDTIMDFTQGADIIDLSAIDAIKNVAGSTFDFIGALPFSHTAGELHARPSGAGVIIEGDIDGNGTADFQIFCKGAIVFQDSDFNL